jgi:hypothetical protein
MDVQACRISRVTVQMRCPAAGKPQLSSQGRRYATCEMTVIL